MPDGSTMAILFSHSHFIYIVIYDLNTSFIDSYQLIKVSNHVKFHKNLPYYQTLFCVWRAQVVAYMFYFLWLQYHKMENIFKKGLQLYGIDTNNSCLHNSSIKNTWNIICFLFECYIDLFFFASKLEK